MYAQCPECLTVFSLDAAALAQAGGEVVCGHCAVPFDALASLASQLPPEPFQRLPAHAPSGEPPRLLGAVYRPPAEPPVVLDSPAVAGERTVEQDLAQLEFAPRFARAALRKGERRWPWVLVCALLLLGLAAQLAWAKRDALIADPLAGSWLRRACATLGCRLPLVRDVHRLELLARDVRAHPSVPGALMISATLHNEATFAQPYPIVTLVLTDAGGKRVAMRRLRPDEYLDDEATRREGLPPGGNAALLVEMTDPGAKAVAFEFGFE
ncbi:zinc-ribbon and DUF3426 domain-containing protein [Frateuria defendens]|uniref:zinc-ribbon and DUF3426 domain-containing protein n=1 Tax=Frateuria defendens TaxID=2219559 RepID=UPI00066FF05D|nr:zinc-ribbon and DUF3426 domain-containing protein [Frateuria defendens]